MKEVRMRMITDGSMYDFDQGSGLNPSRLGFRRGEESRVAMLSVGDGVNEY